MLKVAVQSVKGGVGKSTVSAGLCYALRDGGYKVGYLEVDISGTSGHRAFGIEPPRLGLNTETSQLVPPAVDGIRMFPLASKFTEDACVGWRESDSVIALSDGSEAKDPGRRGFIQEILTRGVDWGDTEYLILDLPPSSGQDVMSFYDYITDLFGVLLVSQPSEIAVVGLLKTLDFLKGKEKPIIGLVENMGSCLCPHCNRYFYPFASKGVDLRRLAKDEGVPFIISLPQVDAMERLKPYFDNLAAYVISSKPRVFRQSFLGGGQRAIRNFEKLFVKGVGRVLPKL